ncbi:MAG TPA: trypsin-like peptidase domain-containing protein [Thermoanaerobaculia bacterium]|jgi:serine protease Do|nr:trypsin-like peptidase domain-containing protein [Thermoanaerobaculia bacterium]
MTKQAMLFLGFLLIAMRVQVLAAPPGAASFNTLASASGSFERIADQVSPSVVQIFVNGYGFTRGPSGVLAKQAGTASGTVLDADGLIVTNAHVVTRATRVQVLVPAVSAPGSQQAALAVPQGVKLDAEVVGIDTATDLAVLKIPAHGLRPLELGDSSQLKQGQLVLAFGSPLGLGNTVTMGVVSALARQLDADDVPAYIQTDAPINPGNSGGPLVDTEGRVVGINTMILSQSGGSEGVGLAIPSNTVRYIASQLRANGRVRRVVMGVAVQTVSPAMAAALKLPQAWGVVVSDIDPDGPAASSDLKVGDVILSVDGKRTANVREFAINLYPHPSGSTLELQVQRGAEALKLQAGVIERPDDPRSVLDLVRPDRNLVPELDLLGVDVDEKLAAALHSLRQASGVMVAAMSADALPPADRFQPGDIIHSVNRTPVHSLAELRQAVAGLKEGDPVVVQIERGGIFTFLAFEID